MVKRITEIYVLFLQNCLIFEEAIRSLEKDKLHLSYLMLCVNCKKKKKTLIQWKNDSFFGKKTALQQKKMSPEMSNQIKQDFLNFLSRTITYLESNFDFTNLHSL